MRVKDYNIGTTLYLGFSLTIAIIVLAVIITFTEFSGIIHQIRITKLTSANVTEVENAQVASLPFAIHGTYEYHNLIDKKNKEQFIKSKQTQMQTNNERFILIIDSISNNEHKGS